MYFFIALVLAVLSGLGVGGGGLFALYLKLFSDYSQLEVQTLNLLFFLFASAAALLVHIVKGRISFSMLAVSAAFGVVGALVGSALAQAIEGELLGKIFGALMIATGIAAWRK